jgi:hypothetical protein
MLQDGLHHLFLGEKCQHHPPAAAGAVEHVLAEDAQEQLAPRDSDLARGPWSFRTRTRLGR